MSQQLAAYQGTDLLVNKLMTEIKALQAPKPVQRGTFAEPEENHDGFGMPSMGGLLTVQRGNLLVMGLGAALAGTVGGLISRFIPITGLNGLPQIIAGIVGKKFIGKSGALQDFFNGVLIAGIALLVGGFVGGIGGGTTTGTLFAERKAAFSEPSFGTTPTAQARSTGFSGYSASRPVVF